MRIMFVCYANTSRSAMAEAIFKGMVGDDVEVSSSGIMAQTGRKSSDLTVEVCRSHGIDLSGHRACNFRSSNIGEMDLVLTLEELYTEKVKIYYPDLEICTIKQFIGEYPPDIGDPVGGDFKVYDACFCEIHRCLEKVRSRLKLLHPELKIDFIL
jgi:protein-tyrosine-phosphatase